MAKTATPAALKKPAAAGKSAAKPSAKRTAAAKAHPIYDQIAATRDTIKSEAGKKAKSLKGEASTLASQRWTLSSPARAAWMRRAPTAS